VAQPGNRSAGLLSCSTSFSGYSFSYDARNRQTQACVGAIGTNWLINGLGQRIAQTIAQFNVSVAQFFFVYDEAGHQTGKYDGLGNPLWETAWLGDLPVAVLSPSGQFYIAPDHLGSPHQITDASGAVVWLWHPDPFGNGDPTGAFPYELRFPGQFFDQGTRLHYNYFRDYDPRTGRYIESDPIGLAGGINTYAYVGGNPVTNTDPEGTQTIPLPWVTPCLANPYCAGLLAAATVGALICERRTFSSGGRWRTRSLSKMLGCSRGLGQ
jgi:RHS repeat-associated protein